MIKVCMGLDEHQGKKPGSEVPVAGDGVKLKKGKFSYNRDSSLLVTKFANTCTNVISFALHMAVESQ